ncbi:MAG: 30S ribosomal protein S11 [Candidatus Dojkabacteria bacterium]
MAKSAAAKKVDKQVVKKKKNKVSVPKVLVRVNSTYNNTIISVTDYAGNVISYSSCGLVGFKGSKKSTAYAATKAGEDAALKAVQQGARESEVIVDGVGIGRQAAVKGIRTAGLRITALIDKTPVPHGGTKPRKKPKK